MRSITVPRWWLGLIMLWLVAANVGIAGWVYRARQNALSAQGCHEVLTLLERPPQPVHTAPPIQYVPGTRIYQDFEK